MVIDEEPRNRGISPSATLYSILGFWLFYMAIVTTRAVIVGFEAQGEMAMRRIVVTIVGIVLTWALYLILRTVDRASLPARISVAVIAAMPIAIAVACTNYYIFNIYDQASMFQDMAHDTPEKMGAFKEIAEFSITRYFFFIAWAALYLALCYASDTRRAERRASALETAAQQAELRSLRYQVNPHFLFNTLNSLSSLVLKDRNDEAEAMIMSLSNFYRSSLTSDPLEDVPLSDEVQLQKLYLDIEAVRFPSRLRTAIAIPDALMNCCVPGLILQPLVENAIKYGVSRTTRPVTITIRAEQEGDDTLHITVSDDGDPIPADEVALLQGSGIGLVNVRDRLSARFGGKGRFSAQSLGEGGFVADIRLPLIRSDC